MNNKKLLKIAARKRIVQHLRRRGHVADFKVTPILVMRWWNLLNEALFDQKLIPPKKIMVKAFRYDYGTCTPTAKRGIVKLSINSEFIDRKTFLAVLAHEMIHQWQWTEIGEMTHGQTFWQWEPTLKKTLNLPLYESY